MQYFFGSGSLYGRQTGVSNPTPIRFGAIQDVSVDISFSTKQLFGQYQFPLAVARGQAKITGKATFGQLSGLAFNNLFFGETSLGTTPVVTAIDEIQTVSANIVTATHNTTYVEDLGVIDAANGLIMTRVASTPLGVANYSVNETTGVYTFNNAFNASVVAISYDYNGTAASGTLITMANQLAGSQPQFLLVLAGSFQSKAARLKLNACMSSKLTFGTKMDDFTLPEFDFEAFADTTGNVGQLSFAE